MFDEETKQLDQMLAEANRLHRRFEVPAGWLTGSQGQDQSGTVTVVLNSRGLVTKVAVDRAWRERLRPHQVSSAVLDAITAAATELFTAWGKAVAGNDSRTPEPDVAPPPSADVVADPAAALEEIIGLLERLDAELDGVTEGVVTLATAKTVGESAGRHVRTTMTGKQITAIDIDPAWLATANHQDIAGEVLGSIRCAYDRARQRAADTLSNSAATRLQEMTANPVELSRRLGMS